MVLLMFGFALVTWWLLRAITRGAWRVWRPRWLGRRYAALHAVLVTGLASIFIAAGWLVKTPQSFEDTEALEWARGDTWDLILSLAACVGLGVLAFLAVRVVTALCSRWKRP
jgi:hypothetical protein